jgi:hypothetical protein
MKKPQGVETPPRVTVLQVREVSPQSDRPREAGQSSGHGGCPGTWRR